MGTWQVESELRGLSEADRHRLKIAGLEYLSNNDLDNEGCAKFLKISLPALFELRGEFASEFLELETLTFLRLERRLHEIALGKIPTINPTEVSSIKWILERRTERYKSASAAKKSTNSNPKRVDENLGVPNGKGSEILAKYMKS